MKKVEIIDNSVTIKCNRCTPSGCESCNGTKEYKREKFILVADNKGQKIAFDVDQAGK